MRTDYRHVRDRCRGRLSRMALVACWLALLQVAGFTETKPITPVGDYTCHGTTQGRPYSLSLKVEAEDAVYKTAWFDARGIMQYGYGIVEGGRFAVVIVNARDQGLGVVMYTVERGVLTGVWSGGDGRVEKEVCTAKAVRSARR